MIQQIENDGLIYCNIPLDKDLAVNKMGVPEAAFDAALKDYQWQQTRSQRDQLMAETDWTQTGDSPLSDTDKTAFKTYRQTLRDIPQKYTDADQVVWPDKPKITKATATS